MTPWRSRLPGTASVFAAWRFSRRLAAPTTTRTVPSSAGCGQVAGKRQLEELVRAAAVDVAAFYTARTPVPSTNEVLLVLVADAKGIVMRPDALRPDTAKAAAGKKRGRGVFRTRLASGEKSCRKRMAALACVYDAAPAPRRPHDVIAVPGGRTGGRALRKGPRARAKWLTASVDRDAAAVIAAAFDQAEARDPAHRRCWVVLDAGDLTSRNARVRPRARALRGGGCRVQAQGVDLGLFR